MTRQEVLYLLLAVLSISLLKKDKADKMKTTALGAVSRAALAEDSSAPFPSCTSKVMHIESNGSHMTIDGRLGPAGAARPPIANMQVGAMAPSPPALIGAAGGSRNGADQ